MTSVLNMDKDVLINTTTTDDQYAGAITRLADGGWVITWQGKDGPSTRGVFCQRYDADGHKVGGEVGVNTYLNGAQTEMKIAGLAGGGWVVTWVSDGQDGSYAGVFGQRYDSAGNPAGAEFRVNTVTESHQYGSKVTALADGGFVVVWHSMNTVTNDYEVRTQRYYADGTTFGGETTVNALGMGGNWGPVIGGLSNGDYVVAWAGYTAGNWGLYTRTYGQGGGAGEVRLVTPVNGSAAPGLSISALASGGYVLTWNDNSGKSDPFDQALKMQAFDAAGNAIGSTLTFDTYAHSGEAYATVCGLSDGGFVVAFQRSDDDYVHNGVFFQRFDAQGNAVGPEIAVNDGTRPMASVPDIMALDDGGFAFVFTGNDGNGSGVFYRAYSSAETLTGTQYLWGTGEADDLNGGSGNDKMYGGKGDDTYHVNAVTDLVYEAANEGDDTVETSVTWTLGAHVENLVLTGTGTISGTGNDAGNYILGNSRNNVLTGLGGDDQMEAGGGNDNLVGGDGNDYMEGGSGNDTFDGGAWDDQMYGDAGNDWFWYSTGMDYIYGGSGVDSFDASYAASGLSINLSTGKVTGAMTSTRLDSIERAFGSNYNDTITGTTGDNILDGRGGNDSLKGGDGDDSYYVESDADIIIELADQGYDAVYAAGNYTLTANVEELWVYVGHASATGNALDNRLYATGGNNLLNGMAGADTMEGGGGNDTYVVDDAGDVVVEYTAGSGTDYVQTSISYALSQYVEHLVLTGTANINGGGNGLDNTLTGNSGLNVLTGGAGDDTYFVQNSGDTVVETAGEGEDVVVASVTFSLAGSQAEHITLIGNDALNATGNALNNILIGNAGVNVLSGGLGDDTYYVQNATDNVVEASGQGSDLVISAVSYSLAGRFAENLVLTGIGNLEAIGNGLANSLTGTIGDNVIDGGTGNDTMIGGLGNDTYYVQAVGDNVVENAGEGTDLISSTVTYSLVGRVVENMILTGAGHAGATGNGLANSLTGNAGNNLINGMGGKDLLVGGAGADIFLFQAASGQDRITDFSVADNDTININAYSGGVANGGGVTISQSGADALIDLGGGNTILVLNTSAADPNFLGHITW